MGTQAEFNNHKPGGYLQTTESVTPETFTINCAKSFLKCLLSDENDLKIGVLESMAEHPDKAQEYFSLEGRDLVRELMDIQDAFAGQIRVLFARALCHQRDRRVSHFLVKELMDSAGFVYARELTKLHAQFFSEHSADLEPVLWSPLLAVAELVAPLLDPSNLSPQSRLRQYLLQRGLKALNTDGMDREDFAKEIKGPLFLEMLTVLERFDSKLGADLLCENWSGLKLSQQLEILASGILAAPLLRSLDQQSDLSGALWHAYASARVKGLEKPLKSSLQIVSISKEHRAHPDPNIRLLALLKTWNRGEELNVLDPLWQKRLLDSLPKEKLPAVDRLRELLWDGSGQIVPNLARRLVEVDSDASWIRERLSLLDGREDPHLLRGLYLLKLWGKEPSDELLQKLNETDEWKG